MATVAEKPQPLTGFFYAQSSFLTKSAKPFSLFTKRIEALLLTDFVYLQATFEALFREFDPCAVFCYLRSFRRVRIDFNSHITAAAAKANLDGQAVADSVIHCYFVQVSAVSS